MKLEFRRSGSRLPLASWFGASRIIFLFEALHSGEWEIAPDELLVPFWSLSLWGFAVRHFHFQCVTAFLLEQTASLAQGFLAPGPLVTPVKFLAGLAHGRHWTISGHRERENGSGISAAFRSARGRLHFLGSASPRFQLLIGWGLPGLGFLSDPAASHCPSS